MSLNRITISGRLVDNPVLQETNSCVPVVNISLAVERDFKDAQTGERGVDWVDVVAYRHTAEMVAKWFKKGDTMIVDGRLQINYWEDKYKKKHKKAVVLASLVYFGSQKKKEEGQESYHASAEYGGTLYTGQIYDGGYIARNNGGFQGGT